MTSKTELKELIELLRDEIRELRMEVEVLKTVVDNKTYVYPFGTTPSYKTNGIDFKSPGATTIQCPDLPSQSSTSDFTKYPNLTTYMTYQYDSLKPILK